MNITGNNNSSKGIIKDADGDDRHHIVFIVLISVSLFLLILTGVIFYEKMWHPRKFRLHRDATKSLFSFDYSNFKGLSNFDDDEL